MEKNKRLYRVPDTTLLQAAKAMRQQFMAYQATFVAFDTDLASPFEDTWQDTIDQCEDLLNDETVRDQLQQLTSQVKAAMKACHNKFMDTKYFIRKAYPENAGKWKAYGFDRFLVDTRKQLGMIEFMKVLHARATEDAAELNAVGYDNAAIAEIETLLQALVNADLEQEAFKGARGVSTAERKQAFNDLWRVLQTVNRVSRSVYRNDLTKKKLFQLPVPARRKKATEPAENDLT